MAPIDGVKMRVPVAPARGSLCDALETLLDTGVVIAGEIVIKVADVELLYVGLELVACSTETARRIEPSPIVGEGTRSANRSPDLQGSSDADTESQDLLRGNSDHVYR